MTLVVLRDATEGAAEITAVQDRRRPRRNDGVAEDAPIPVPVPDESHGLYRDVRLYGGPAVAVMPRDLFRHPIETELPPVSTHQRQSQLATNGCRSEDVGDISYCFENQRRGCSRLRFPGGLDKRRGRGNHRTHGPFRVCLHQLREATAIDAITGLGGIVA